MKNVLLLLLALLLSACASTKKSLETSTIKVDSLGHQAAREVKVERLTDTTKTASGRLIVTEIEFFISDSSLGSIESLSINAGDVDVSNIRGKPIRSIRQQTFESITEKKGEDKESREDKEQQQAVSVQKENIKQTKQASPAPDPYRWRYIFYLSIVALTGILYLKRMPIINWIKKMLCGLIKR